MATPAEVQAQLSTSPMGAKILQAVEDNGASGAEYYVQGGTDVPGRARWCVTTKADSAATQAASILTSLRA